MGPLFSYAKWSCELAIKWTERQKCTSKSPHFSGSTVVHGPRSASAFYRHPLLPQLKGYKNRETLNLRIEDKRKTAATSLYLSQFEFNLNNDVPHSGRKYYTILCLQ